MKCLDLFSGTGSVADSLKALGHDVVSLDVSCHYSTPDIVQDILTWDYKSAFKPGHFDFVWASPPCTEYSCMKSIRVWTHGIPRNLELADSLVLKALEIIEYLRPKYYVIENPASGMLKTRSFMAARNYTDVDYCQYGKDYRKWTRLWHNIPGFTGLRCDRATCSKIVANQHVAQVCKKTNTFSKRTSNRAAIYRIPELLIAALVATMEHANA